MNSRILPRILIAAAVVLSPVAVGAALVGCTGTVTPVQVAQTVEQSAQIAVAAATSAWNFILPSLPAASQAAANAKFQKSLVAVTDGLATLNDAVVAFQNATGPAPNWGMLISTLSDAVGNVLAIVNEFKTGATAAHGGLAAGEPIPGYAELVQSAATLNKAAHPSN